MYTLEGCPACKNAKELFAEKKITVVVKDSSEFETDKGGLLGIDPEYHYWPKIFNPNRNFVGGYDKLVKLLGEEK